jgi:serine/threonine protein kinase
MTRPESWPAITDLFHRALSRPPAERRRFLEAECRDAPALLAEVTALLEAHASAGSFLEVPVRDGVTGEPASATLVGRTVGHYHVERVLGEGGMGIVYLARDARLHRFVALKALPARHTRDETSRGRLRREARAAATLAHPGIAAVHALEEIGDDLFIVFEYVPGATLREEIGRGPLPPRAVLDTGLALARAIGAAHARGIVHRDLKPENVVRTLAGDLKILDFGLARFRDPETDGRTLGAPGSVMGTPAHMSPEQIRGEPVDARSDLFSLGVLLYELATGANPFRGADYAATVANILEARVPALPLAPPGDADQPLELALERIIGTLLERSPGARFQSAEALIQALEAAGGGAPDPVPTRLAGAPGSPSGAEGPVDSALWWWKFHQAATSVMYAALVVPLWFVHDWTPGLPALLLLLAGLASGLVAGVLRLHLWFTIRSYPGEWPTQRRTAGRWIAAGDVSYSAVLAIAALTVAAEHPRVGALLVAAAAAAVISFAVIEPATTRAAFDARRTIG